MMDKPEGRQRSTRTESESSIPPEDRRVAVEENEHSEHEEVKEEDSHHKHGHRRFSLDFLFNKKGKKDKTKKKRSNSTQPEDSEAYSAHRYPGIEAHDFSCFYFM
jgi:hypothetical protein